MRKLSSINVSFMHMLSFVRQDMMLLAAGLSPFLIGVAMHFGIPAIEKELIRITGLSCVMTPYYSLFDIFYAAITPVMFCFVAAMVMLEEHDEHIDRYLFVTGLGKRGYFASRLVIPGIAAFIVTVALLPFFRLSEIKAIMMIFLSVAGTLQGIIITLLVVALSSNKLEGMALTKMSSLIMLGAIAPYFIPVPYRYCLAFLPSFWTGMTVVEERLAFMLMNIIVSGIWIYVLWRRFEKKIR